MVASVPALYPTSQIGLLLAADQEARRWSGRLTHHLMVINGVAAVVMLGLWWARIALPLDGVAVFLAPFVLGVACALLAMLVDLSRWDEVRPLGQSRWLIWLRRAVGRIDGFWLLFFGLLSFVVGAAGALIALATAPAASTSVPGQVAAMSAAPAAGPAPPALTQAAVGYWESELARALLAGDRGLFLASCASLTELHARSGICDLGGRRR
jgi:hypothetical protein